MASAKQNDEPEPTVQTTSIAVLWLVLDGTGLALSAELDDARGSRRIRTKMVIGTMNHSVYCSNQLLNSMMEVAGSCIPICQGFG